tara:strand:+ start:291 stop:689 length:399 start_codon:yes stop_codon:yes gene_type:complete
LGIKILKKLKYKKPTWLIMGKYIEKAGKFHKNMLVLTSSEALLEKFEELLIYWEQFDRLWRLSYAPPLQNERQLGNMVTLLNETFGECKDLYNTCQLDLNSSVVLQYLPLEHIIFEKGFKKDAKSQQKEQKN